jgi:glycosyltransferase involved in cell wall biosynthesis
MRRTTDELSEGADKSPLAKDQCRVLHVSMPTDGGTARCVRDIAHYQSRQGWSVVIASPGKGWLQDAGRRVGATHVTWDAARDPSPAMASEVLALQRIIKRVRPGVVHLHSSKAGLAGRLAVRGLVPTVFQPHAWSFEPFTGGRRALSIRWERWAVRWTNVTVCVSRSEMFRGVEAGIDGRYRVVPNGIDPSIWRPATRADSDQAKVRLGVADAPTVVCIGRLCRQKGQDVLLDAWEPVTGHLRSARLVLVGGGPDEESLRSRAPERVTFVGERADVVDWLAAADVVCIPSRWDGMSLALLEAMARGRSIVATDVPGVRDALRGRTGAVVPVERPDELARALLTRLLDPALTDSEGRAARELAERHHDLRRTTEMTSLVYDEVLHPRRWAVGHPRSKLLPRLRARSA